MSLKKKQIRNFFNSACLARDGYKCIVCGFQSNPENAKEDLNVHHITDRNEMPNGGYVKENGATLCKHFERGANNCHWHAEQFHITGKAEEGFSPVDLYKKIGCSYEKALVTSKKI